MVVAPVAISPVASARLRSSIIRSLHPGTRTFKLEGEGEAAICSGIAIP